MPKLNVLVAGSTGYIGVQLISLLIKHKKVKIKFINHYIFFWKFIYKPRWNRIIPLSMNNSTISMSYPYSFSCSG